MAASRQHHRALPAPGRTSHRGRALPGRVGRAALAFLATASLATGSASAEEVFTSQAAAANATDSTWIPAPSRRAAVCIVDTGTDTTPDTTNVVARFSMDDSDGSDVSPIKHGTLMATIASAPKNDFGMVGATPSVDVVSVRASRDGVSFGGIDVQAAVQLCIAKRVAYNIKVVSLSLGGDGVVIAASVKQRNEFQNVIDNARLHDLNVVAAAGNSERGVVDWPAGYGPTFAIGAATGPGARCSFSSWGAEVDLWAPGCPLDVGRPDATGSPAWANGSSEATAFVAAILAQMRGLDPGLGVDASEKALLTGARGGSAGAMLDVGTAFRTIGLTASLASGHSAAPAATPIGMSTSSVEQASGNKPQTDGLARTGDVPARPSEPTTVAIPATPVDRVIGGQLARPLARLAAGRAGLLLLRLRNRPRGAEARVDIYARKRGKAFPTIAKRVRFRADILRIRVSGTISQLSIGYRDPTGVLERSEVIVVHPRT